MVASEMAFFILSLSFSFFTCVTKFPVGVTISNFLYSIYPSSHSFFLPFSFILSVCDF